MSYVFSIELADSFIQSNEMSDADAMFCRFMNPAGNQYLLL